MKRKIIIFCIICIALILSVVSIANYIEKNRLTNEKMPELRDAATKTTQMLRIGENLERIESDEGYYKIKGSEHYQWSVKDAFNLTDISLARVQAIDTNMIMEGWNREKGLRSSLEEDYTWAKKWHSSYTLKYSRATKTTPMCQRFSFWWSAQILDKGGAANMFIYTEYTDYC